MKMQYTEGFYVNVDMALENLDKEQVRSFIIPGVDVLKYLVCTEYILRVRRSLYAGTSKRMG